MFRYRIPLHWFVTTAFLIALIPLFSFARLPLRVDLAEIGGAYWGGTGVRALFCGILLYAICFPWAETGKPLVDRLLQNKWLGLELVAFFALMYWCFGPSLGAIVVVDGIAIAELFMRRTGRFRHAFIDLGIPALYFFVGIIVVFAFQHGLAGVRFAGMYDAAFSRFDRLIFNTNVSQIAHSAMAFLPRWTVHVLEFSYYSLFAQMGGTLILCALLEGRGYAVRYVATLLISYYIALVIFGIWPTLGPFSICATHSTDYPKFLPTFVGQQAIVAKAKMLSMHVVVPETSSVRVLDYYIGFPCMHIALPIIAIWWLRKWPRMAMILAVFDIVLVFSIVVLEWHYLVDLVAGVGVAGLAIYFEYKQDPRKERAQVHRLIESQPYDDRVRVLSFSELPK